MRWLSVTAEASAVIRSIAAFAELHFKTFAEISAVHQFFDSSTVRD